jgi:sugar phosphate isomerase/epimerase
MLYGNSIPFKNTEYIKILKEAGYDYVETPLAPMYAAAKAEIGDFSEALERNGIKCAAVNVLFPPDIRLTGNNSEFGKAGDYIKEIFEKTKNLKFEKVVFGSGGARRVPEDFSKEAAMEQLAGIIKDYLLPAAEKYGFTLVLEELNKGETNILNSVGECAVLIKQINNPKVKLLADLYHITLENDDLENLSAYGDMLAHCHIANALDNRFYPHASDSLESINLYKKFFNSLKAAGYSAGVSIEGAIGKLTDTADIKIPAWVSAENKLFYAESKKSLDFMKTL